MITFSLKTDYLCYDNSLVPQSQTAILPRDTNDRVQVPKSSQGKVFGKGEQTATDRGALRKIITQKAQGHSVPVPYTELSSRTDPPARKEAQKQIPGSGSAAVSRD